MRAREGTDRPAASSRAPSGPRPGGVFLAATLLLLMAAVTGCGPRRLGPPPDPAVPSVFVPPEPESLTLANGMTVSFRHAPEVPLVEGTLVLPGGILSRPDLPAGVLHAAGVSARAGGAGPLGPDELDRLLVRLAATVSSGIGPEAGVFSFSCLKGDLDQVFDVFTDVLLEPRFDEGRLEVLRGQMLDSVRRRRDDGSAIAAVTSTGLMYGDSVYGRVLRSRDVPGLTREKIRNAYHDVVTPAGARLILTGDLTRQDVDRLLKGRIGSWRGGRTARPFPSVGVPARPGIYYVEAPFSQATVIAAKPGAARFTDDHFPVLVFNEVLGSGGMVSRLYNRVRSELGLAYGVSGAVGTGPVRGVSTVALQTKSATAGEALAESLAVVARLRDAPVPEAELAERKSAVVNSFVFANEDAHASLVRKALLALYGFPADYDARYVSQIGAVTGRDVAGVARRRWDVDDLVVTVVGDDAARRSVEAARQKLPASLGGPVVRMRFDEVAEVRP